MALVKRILFVLFWERRRNRQKVSRDLTCGFLVSTIDEAYQWLAVKGTVSAANYECSRQLTPRSRQKPIDVWTKHKEDESKTPHSLPQHNEVECMPATSLHVLLDWMHNTLSQLQIAAGRACGVIYSLNRVSSPWPVMLAMVIFFLSVAAHLVACFSKSSCLGQGLFSDLTALFCKHFVLNC